MPVDSSSDVMKNKSLNHVSYSSVESTQKQNGKFVFANGDVYDGEYEVVTLPSGVASIERNGVGTLTSSEGLIYSGNWQNDKMNGKGIFQHPSGMKYEGDFIRGKFEGIGKYIWPDGSYYEGEFKDSKLEGQGYFRDPTGQLWTGKFKGKYADRLKFKLNM